MHAAFLEYQRRMLHSKASRWQWESHAIFYLEGFIVIRFLDYNKEITLNYTKKKNYKNTRCLGNMTSKIIPLIY